jgi:methyl-accepting chemotaxis protein
MDYFSKVKLKNRVIFLSVFLIMSFTFLIGGYIIPAFNNSVETQAENKMQSLIEVAYSIIQNYYNAYESGEITLEQAKERAIYDIKGLRYGENYYFFIIDYTPIMVMHPIQEELNGLYLKDYKDPNGIRIFVDMVNVVNQNGEGLVYYDWEKDGDEDLQPKMSYVKGFKEWEWIVGSGIFIDDLHETKADILRNIFVVLAIIVAASIAISLFLILSITKTINIITNMVEQTNFIALNAAAENEENQDIAEVAKEVKKMVIESKNKMMETEEQTKENDEKYNSTNR